MQNNNDVELPDVWFDDLSVWKPYQVLVMQTEEDHIKCITTTLYLNFLPFDNMCCGNKNRLYTLLDDINIIACLIAKYASNKQLHIASTTSTCSDKLRNVSIKCLQ